MFCGNSSAPLAFLKAVLAPPAMYVCVCVCVHLQFVVFRLFVNAIKISNLTLILLRSGRE